MNKDKALDLALEALETPRPTDSYPPLWRSYKKTINDAITAIKQARSAPVQEPVEKYYVDGGHIVYPAAQRQRVVFPTMLRKMWSGGEVQAWLDENVNKENT